MSPENFSSVAWIADGFKMDDDIPAVIQIELDGDMDRDTIVRMRYLARKKRLSRPDITDDEMADYLALAENSRNFEQWISTRRSQPKAAVRPIYKFLAVTAVILGLLTAMLVMAIAITV